MAVDRLPLRSWRGDTEADYHDVLPLLRVPHRLYAELTFVADTPLAAVYNEKAAGVGAVTGVGDLSVGIGQLHLLGDYDRDPFHSA